MPSPGKQHNPPPCLLIDTNQRCHIAAGDVATRRRRDNRDTHHLAPQCNHNGHATTRLRQPRGLTTTNQQLPTTTPCHCPQMKTDCPRTRTDAPEQRRLPTNEGSHPRTKTITHEHEQTWGTTRGPRAMTRGHGQRHADMGNDTQTRAMTRGHGQRRADTGNDAQTQATMRGHGK